MSIINERTLHLPVSYRLAINMMSIIGRVFGRDERLTAHLTLLGAEIEAAATDDESYDAMVESVAYTLKAERSMRHA